MSCNKISNLCSNPILSTCVDFEGELGKNTKIIDECVNQFDVNEDLYSITDDIIEGLDISELSSTCMNIPSNPSISDILTVYEDKVCELDLSVSFLNDFDYENLNISEWDLDYPNSLINPCEGNKTTLSKWMQMIMDQYVNSEGVPSYMSGISLNGTNLNFASVGLGFSGNVDLSSLTGVFPGFVDLPTDYGVTLSAVATSGSYNDLNDQPILFTPSTLSGDYGILLSTVATTNNYDDLDNLPILGNTDVVSNVATSTILGRVTIGSGDSEELTPTQVRTLLNIEDGATVDQDISGIITNAASISGNSSNITELQNSQSIQDSAIALNTAKQTYPSVDATKLSNIEDGAQVNPTNTEIVSSIDTELGNTDWRTLSSNKYSETIGNNTDTTFNLNHNLNDLDITGILIRDLNTGEILIGTTPLSVDANNISISFGTPPTNNQYRITISI